MNQSKFEAFQLKFTYLFVLVEFAAVIDCFFELIK